MAENEFEKNVRREMDEFKVHPSEEVWTNIEKKISANRRKRRIVFFIFFSLIALMIGGYAIYNFPGDKTKSEAQGKLSAGTRPNPENKIDNSKTEEHNNETITIKPNIPVENEKETNKTFAFAKQRQTSRPERDDKIITKDSKANRVSSEQATAGEDRSAENKDRGNKDNATHEVASAPVDQQVAQSNQNGIARSENKDLIRTDTTSSKLNESKYTRTVQVLNKKKSDKVPTKIAWGVALSLGSSVLTEETFSFKSSYAAADRQYSGGYPGTGGGGPVGGPTTNYTYAQSQNEPAFAFKVGVVARKNISKRSILSAGMGYSYLADKIKIGSNQVLSQSAMSSFFYSGSPQKTHTDKFHFIELPLLYAWRVTNNADHFLSLNAGVSPSFLLTTNALVYDTTMGGIYYFNKDFVTKTHLNFISGIAYQFRSKNELEFSIGPQFSFDVTKAFKSDLDKRKYFLYTGIDARLFFDKKKK